VYVSSTPAMADLGRQPGTSAFRPLAEHPDGEVLPGLLVVRFDGGLTFVTAEGLVDGLGGRLLDEGATFSGVVIDFAGVTFVDSQGAGAVGLLVDQLERDGLSLRLARVRGDVLAVLAADGVLARLGADHIYSNVDEAVRAELELRHGPAAAP
jgi:sulfate permease, SulP family